MDFDEHDEREEMVLRCGYPGCCMPGYHFRHECHNEQDLQPMLLDLERILVNDQAEADKEAKK